MIGSSEIYCNPRGHVRFAEANISEKVYPDIYRNKQSRVKTLQNETNLEFWKGVSKYRI